MRIGIFDHLDRNNLPLDQYYEARLQIAEAYERAGFHAYHLAEHHFTPLGVAPSPSVFLAALAQRTSRLRFGPLVYAVPLHHPVRLLEEICMLDQLSGGRLEIGFGRGSSPIEAAYYGCDPAEAQKIYQDGLDLILKGFSGEPLSYPHSFGDIGDIPLELTPFQKPHPPMWYGAHSPESAEKAARRGLHVINNDAPERTRPCLQRFYEVWREEVGDTVVPMAGVVRFIFVAEDDETAMAAARRAYEHWYRSFNYLFRMHGRAPMLGERVVDFDGVIEKGLGIAGSPDTVRSYLLDQLGDLGANYLVGQFAFGDLSQGEIIRSVELFADEVVPALDEGIGAPAATLSAAESA